ncbi:hypothetical protein H2203_002254 [Taxawa tesnikishii (nom. ined.)]|nr:hypothetical protein H2203_002254 [Dothideales sp. JES 119]
MQLNANIALLFEVPIATIVLTIVIVVVVLLPLGRQCNFTLRTDDPDNPSGHDRSHLRNADYDPTNNGNDSGLPIGIQRPHSPFSNHVAHELSNEGSASGSSGDVSLSDGDVPLEDPIDQSPMRADHDHQVTAAALPPILTERGEAIRGQVECLPYDDTIQEHNDAPMLDAPPPEHQQYPFQNLCDNPALYETPLQCYVPVGYQEVPRVFPRAIDAYHDPDHQPLQDEGMGGGRIEAAHPLIREHDRPRNFWPYHHRSMEQNFTRDYYERPEDVRGDFVNAGYHNDRERDDAAQEQSDLDQIRRAIDNTPYIAIHPVRRSSRLQEALLGVPNTRQPNNLAGSNTIQLQGSRALVPSGGLAPILNGLPISESKLHRQSAPNSSVRPYLGPRDLSSSGRGRMPDFAELRPSVVPLTVPRRSAVPQPALDQAAVGISSAISPAPPTAPPQRLDSALPGHEQTLVQPAQQYRPVNTQDDANPQHPQRYREATPQPAAVPEWIYATAESVPRSEDSIQTQVRGGDGAPWVGPPEPGLPQQTN